jgi:hypothetical protein
MLKENGSWWHKNVKLGDQFFQTGFVRMCMRTFVRTYLFIYARTYRYLYELSEVRTRKATHAGIAIETKKTSHASYTRLV